jgi:hypothetical protein
MAAPFNEIQLTEILLRSKHLVVVLGKNNGPCHIMVSLTSLKVRECPRQPVSRHLGEVEAFSVSLPIQGIFLTCLTKILFRY